MIEPDHRALMPEHPHLTRNRVRPIMRRFGLQALYASNKYRCLLRGKAICHLNPGFCIAALEEAIERYGEPAILNTDQGSQFTIRTARNRDQCGRHGLSTG